MSDCVFEIRYGVGDGVYIHSTLATNMHEFWKHINHVSNSPPLIVVVFQIVNSSIGLRYLF